MTTKKDDCLGKSGIKKAARDEQLFYKESVIHYLLFTLYM